MAANADLRAVAEDTRLLLLDQPSIGAAYTRAQLESGSAAGQPYFEQVRRTWHREMSGDVQFVLRPYWMYSSGTVGTTHGSPHYERPGVAAFGQYAVDPAFKGRGIGAQLLELVEQRARAAGAAELALDTSEHAADLIALYERKGFRFVEHAQWRDVNYRSVVMSKELRPTPPPPAS